MANVFISYRRSDTTSGYASWLYDRLAATFGPDHVFMDVDSIALGVDFVDHLRRALDATDVAVVLIGPGWLNAVNETGVRRLENQNDFVHLEVATALRAGIRVVPVLVDGAHMPDESSLPLDLRALTTRQALIFDRHGGTAIRELLAAISPLSAGSELGRTFIPPGSTFADADALFDKARAFQRQRQTNDALAAYSQLADGFGARREPEIRNLVIRALYYKSVLLSQQGRPQDSLAVCDQLLTQCPDPIEETLLEPVAMALWNKGALLRRLERRQDALAVNNELVARFSGCRNADVRGLVWKAKEARFFNKLPRWMG